jgi:hypothetical protein
VKVLFAAEDYSDNSDPHVRDLTPIDLHGKSHLSSEQTKFESKDFLNLGLFRIVCLRLVVLPDIHFAINFLSPYLINAINLVSAFLLA